MKTFLGIMLTMMLFSCGTAGQEISSIPYELDIDFSSDMPTDKGIAFSELNEKLPVEMKDAIKTAFLNNYVINDYNISFYEEFILELFDKMSSFTPTSEGTFIRFRSNLMEHWKLSERSKLTSTYFDKGLDSASVFAVLFQLYAAELCEIQLDEEKLIDIELLSDEDWEKWKAKNLK